MRILLTSDEAGGLGVHARELAHGLAARGHRVGLAILGSEHAAHAEIAGIHLYRAPWPMEWESERPVAELQLAADAAQTWLRRLAREFGADVLHANHFSLAGAVPALPTLLGVHSDVVSWWRAVHGEVPDTAFHGWYRGIAERGLHAAQAVVVPSRTAGEDLRQSFAWGGTAQVIPNGIHAAAPTAPKLPLAASLGRLWDEGKQARLLWRDDLALPTVLGGESRRALPHPPPCLRLAGSLPRSAAQRLLRRARVYIATSRYEPFGLAPLEAAAAGCALLLNDIPSFRELWDGAALFYDRHDGDALACGLRQLAEDSAQASALGAAAAARATSAYRADAMASSYEQAYHRLL